MVSRMFTSVRLGRCIFLDVLELHGMDAYHPTALLCIAHEAWLLYALRKA